MNEKLEPLEEAMEDVAETAEEAVQQTEDLAAAVAAEATEAAEEAGEAAEWVAKETEEAVEEVSSEAAEVAEEAGQAAEAVAEAAEEAVEEKAEAAYESLEEDIETVGEKLHDVVIEDIEVDAEASDDDRLMALLSYASQLIIPFIVPIILLVSETSKKRPFQRYHAVHSLALSIVAWVLQVILGILVAVLSWTCICPVLLGLVMLVIWLAPLYYGILAYQGKRFEIPALSQFLQDQGWL